MPRNDLGTRDINRVYGQCNLQLSRGPPLLEILTLFIICIDTIHCTALHCEIRLSLDHFTSCKSIMRCASNLNPISFFAEIFDVKNVKASSPHLSREFVVTIDKMLNAYKLLRFAHEALRTD